jgi:hypothetical protein
MTKTLNVTIERGYLIDVSNLTEEQISEIENDLRDNNIEVDDLSDKYDIKPNNVHSDAQVTLENA